MLNLINLSRKYQAGNVETAALNQINLTIDKGEYVAITGPSGCGKSTLLGILGLLDQANAGEYWFDGKNVAAWSESKLNQLRRGRIGFIFQNFNLIEELTVAENVALALEYSSFSGKERHERVQNILLRLGVSHRGKHRPSQLSGGQQQRVAIARALVVEPAILLADAPTGNLDTAHGDEVMSLLRKINIEGTTVVMVTHSASHAAQAGRTVHMLDGKIIDHGLQKSGLIQRIIATVSHIVFYLIKNYHEIA